MVKQTIQSNLDIRERWWGDGEGEGREWDRLQRESHREREKERERERGGRKREGERERGRELEIWKDKMTKRKDTYNKKRIERHRKTGYHKQRK